MVALPTASAMRRSIVRGGFIDRPPWHESRSSTRSENGATLERSAGWAQLLRSCVQTSQLPKGKDVFLDHIAHFVPDMEKASTTLSRLGFVLTPFTHQQNNTPNGPVPAGTANRCVMLRSGYVEILSAVAATELAKRMQKAISRYTGLHLIALSASDSSHAAARLEDQGFEPEQPVHLRRAVDLEDGAAGEARFTVVRVPPEKMPEGRIQVLTHHTEKAVWQDRWTGHENSISSLGAVMLTVEDPSEAAERYGRFSGRRPELREGDRWVLPLDRGRIVFSPGNDHSPSGPGPLQLPMISGYALGSDDPARTAACFESAGVPGTPTAAGETVYVLPPELGGVVTVTEAGRLPSWAR